LTCPGNFGRPKVLKNAVANERGNDAPVTVYRRTEGQDLREADELPVADVAKKHGIRDQMIYQWRRRYGQLEAADAKHVRQLQQEDARLKKLVAERDLEIEVMKEIAVRKW